MGPFGLSYYAVGHDRWTHRHGHTKTHTLSLTHTHMDCTQIAFVCICMAGCSQWCGSGVPGHRGWVRFIPACGCGCLQCMCVTRKRGHRHTTNQPFPFYQINMDGWMEGARQKIRWGHTDTHTHTHTQTDRQNGKHCTIMRFYTHLLLGHRTHHTTHTHTHREGRVSCRCRVGVSLAK